MDMSQHCPSSRKDSPRSPLLAGSGWITLSSDRGKLHVVLQTHLILHRKPCISFPLPTLSKEDMGVLSSFYTGFNYHNGAPHILKKEEGTN